MSDNSVENPAKDRLMRAVGIGGLLGVLLTAGCGGVKPTPPGELPKSAPQAAVEAPAPAVAPAIPPSAPPPSVAPQGSTAAAEPAERPVAPTAPPPSPAQSAVKAAPPAAKSPAKAAAPAAPAAQPKKEAAAKPAKKAEPTLDLTSLETRLKETKAIGVMTKLALKNQVDDLLNQFRAYYQGKLKTTLAELRRPFDLLILKVLSLLQDSDPALAAAIVASREAIWAILADPVKFANVASN
jgi:hypothetical protein